MQISGVPALGIEGERCPFTWVHVGNRDIRRIKDPYAHIVARWLRRVYRCNRNPGQNKQKTYWRFHNVPPFAKSEVSTRREARVEGRVSKRGSRAGCRGEIARPAT